MNDEFPEYVENILEEWDTLAKFAYSGYEDLGRGIVAIFLEDNETSLGYVDKRYFTEHNMKNELELIKNYDPEYEMLVHFEQNNGLRTIRIRTPEGGRDPKSVWFMDMMMRFSNDKNNLPENLPEWFYDKALKFIDGLKNMEKNKNK
jgi:hypothetical protein